MNIKKKPYKLKGWLGIAVLVCLSTAALVYVYDFKSLLSDFKYKLSKKAELSRCDNKYSTEEVLSFVSKIPAESIKGNFPADIEDIKLHIKQKHMDKVKEERNDAIFNDILFDQKSYPLMIEKNNQLMKGKFRLKGDLPDHWKEEDRWSFRIKLKSNNQIQGMREFSLQKPRARQFPYDFIFQDLVQNMGNMSPTFNFLRTYVNGEDWGVMLTEEHIGKSLVEKQKRRSSILLRMDDQSGWVYSRSNKAKGFEISKSQVINYKLPIFDFYNEKKLSLSNTEIKYASYVVSRARDVLYGKRKASSIFDIESFSNAYLATLAWHDHHTIHSSNSKLYFNPYTLKLEIITTDAGLYRKWNPKNKRSPINPKTLSFKQFPIYSRLMMENEFIQDGLMKNIGKLNEALSKTEKQAMALKAKFPLEKSAFVFESQVIYKNIKKIRKKKNRIFTNLSRSLKAKAPNPVMKTMEGDFSNKLFLPKHIEAEYYGSGKLIIYNLLTSSVTVERIIHKLLPSESTELLESSIEIPAGNDGISTQSIEILLPSLRVDSKNPILIHTKIGNSNRVKKVNLSFFDQTINPMLDNIDVVKKINRPEFLKIIGKEVVISQGHWSVTSPIIIPKGYSLKIKADTVLSFSPESYILSKGPIEIKGTKQKHVVLKSMKKSWKGIYVIEAGSESIIRFADIEGTTFFNVGILNLTGGINFYKSPVKIRNTRFLSSIAEDQLNIIHSKIDLQDLEFSNSRSDSFDSDFCTGTIKNIVFKNIGGDALDTSGSKIFVKNISANNIRDKVISGGESSRLKLEGVVAKNAGVVVASKDGSHIILTDIKAEDITVHPIMVYSKKPFYGPASIVVTEKSLNPNQVMVENGNSCILNGEEIQTQKVDVKTMYKTGPMKK